MQLCLYPHACFTVSTPHDPDCLPILLALVARGRRQKQLLHAAHITLLLSILPESLEYHIIMPKQKPPKTIVTVVESMGKVVCNTRKIFRKKHEIKTCIYINYPLFEINIHYISARNQFLKTSQTLI